MTDPEIYIIKFHKKNNTMQQIYHIYLAIMNFVSPTKNQIITSQFGFKVYHVLIFA